MATLALVDRQSFGGERGLKHNFILVVVMLCVNSIHSLQTGGNIPDMVGSDRCKKPLMLQTLDVLFLLGFMGVFTHFCSFFMLHCDQL